MKKKIDLTKLKVLGTYKGKPIFKAPWGNDPHNKLQTYSNLRAKGIKVVNRDAHVGYRRGRGYLDNVPDGMVKVYDPALL